ncbi:MAG: toll/interleukin-1 receptor domain-containing protein [Lachnospiraceae bacterium]|nr:toll/interleukin-1 receptor domain-containing protein [Lachnospiraceae bacterium]
MFIFKCKMCGGTIEFNPGDTVGVCDSCGTKQTLPRLDDERRANLYDRANHFRRNNEYDKAADIYEQVLNEDTTDAEAYWSLVLCRYGIEYVEDPATRKRVPTVNCAQFTSIFDDDNYKSAVHYADDYQRAIYEAEANAINEIQKGILSISQKEEPFDIFICYKETDQDGRRTQDSVLANDLYHQLTNEGFKVFFSRITLEDKLGTAYEPYIFAALNSAKVMVVLGTKPEYFNAVWVKNEWRRYLSLVKQSGGKKVLIPAYRDMDPYDLPEEFSHLQALDMSKLGFIPDLIRGIKKIVKVEEQNQVAKETAVVEGNASVAPLLKRAFMFLDDSNWKEADAYCEKILDQDPENAQAYLGKLMAELRVRRQEDLKNRKKPFDNSNNYQKAVRFGDKSTADMLTGYIDHINERLAEERSNTAEKAKKNRKKIVLIGLPIIIACIVVLFVLKTVIVPWQNLNKARVLLDSGDYEAAYALMEEIGDSEVTDTLKCEKAMALIDSGEYDLANTLLERIDNSELLDSIKYEKADALIETEDYKGAYFLLDGLDYKDSASKRKKIEESDAWRSICPVGKTLFFGAYEQDNNTSNGKEDIEWIVLDKDKDKVLIVSKYALDDLKMSESWSTWERTWEKSDLRGWLNEEFLSAAFSSEEQKNILSTNIVAETIRENHYTLPGNDTTDKVFLLSITEADEYFASDEERKCAPTDYAIAQGVVASNVNSIDGRGTCMWWLRSPGNGISKNSYIGVNGSIDVIGTDNKQGRRAVRPALWMALEL